MCNLPMNLYGNCIESLRRNVHSLLRYQNSMDFNHYDHNTEYGLEIDEYVINGKERHFHRAASSAMEQVINGKATQFQQFDSYKMRKVGDLKVAGCLVRNNRDTAVLDGTLRARNYRKASMEMTFRRRRKHKVRVKVMLLGQRLKIKYLNFYRIVLAQWL